MHDLRPALRRGAQREHDGEHGGEHAGEAGQQPAAIRGHRRLQTAALCGRVYNALRDGKRRTRHLSFFTASYFDAPHIVIYGKIYRIVRGTFTIARFAVAGVAAGVISLAGFPEMARADDAAPGTGMQDVAPIVVTARQRAEDLQQVPVAITVVSGDALTRAYIVNTQALTTQVASLNYSSANPRNTSFTIRGLGSSVVAVSQANDGLEPGVGFYIDGVYHARPATAAFDFSDISQIEVLRGPQGTLFGKNTTAGAISITSKAPSFTPEADEEISVGQQHFVQVKAAASGPLIDDVLAWRISGVVTRRDGVIRNVNTGDYENGIGNQAVRGQLLFTPSANFKLRLIADFTNFDSECCTQVYLRVGTSLRPASKQYP